MSPINDPVDRCQLRPDAGKNSSEVAPVCATACRVVTSIYIAAGTLEPLRPRLDLHGPRVNSRDSYVPDNHKKFAIAVTRARVDHPSFLFLFPPVVRSSHHSTERGTPTA
jgi:hypothetical protein